MSYAAKVDRLIIEKAIAYKNKDLAFARYKEVVAEREQARDELRVAKEVYQQVKERLSERFPQEVTFLKRYYGAMKKADALRENNDAKIKTLQCEANKEHQHMQRSLEQAKLASSFNKPGSIEKIQAEADKHRIHRDKLNAQIDALTRELEEAIMEVELMQQTRLPQAFIAAMQEYKEAKSTYEKTEKKVRFLTKERRRLKKELCEYQKAALAADETYRQGRWPRRKQVLHQAEIPVELRKDAVIEKKDDGTLHVYYGGIKNDNGLGIGHGHVVFDNPGHIIYHRKPFEERGRQNRQN